MPLHMSGSYGGIAPNFSPITLRRCKMKQCNKCNENKSLSEFNKNKTKPDGYQYYCRECEKVYKKKNYLHTKERYLERNSEIRERNKAFLKEIKSELKCSMCGEDHPATLDFHHRDPQEKDQMVSKAIFRGWSIERIKKEIDKCDVLCSNCHRKLHGN